MLSENDNFEVLEGHDKIYTKKSNLFTSILGGRFSEKDIELSVDNYLRDITSKLGNSIVFDEEINTYLINIQQKLKKEPIVIHEDRISHSYKDVPIDLRKINQAYYNGGTTLYIPEGTIFTFIIPISGYTDELINSNYSYKKVYGFLDKTKNIIEIEYYIPAQEADKINLQEEFDKNLKLINDGVVAINKKIADYNQKVLPIIEKCVKQKQESVKKMEILKKTIKYPLRKNEILPQTFVVPLERKKIQIQQSKIAISPIEETYIIDLKDYDNILKICSDMASVMERTPSAFAKIDEESLRIHFLVQLNGHYEGTATGETFNLGGKTDILIRQNNKNIFIAECKYWGGAKKHAETIDQILDYISYRDTKTAILVFVKNKDFTKTIEEMKKATKEHPNCIRQMENYNPPSNSEHSSFRYEFKNKIDSDKHFYLTTMAFHIPENINK